MAGNGTNDGKTEAQRGYSVAKITPNMSSTYKEKKVASFVQEKARLGKKNK